MELEIRVGDEKLIEPDFKIYTNDNDKTLFFIAMKVDIDAEEKIRQSMNNDEFKIEIQNGIIGLTIIDRIYSFDVRGFLRAYLINHVKDQFSVAFAFLDEDDKIKKENVKDIRMRHK
ncbi:hypothetical protein H4F33_13920 [Pectobacterium brasiliense]|uniref:hypothetical protein n=1 Tax=Pectobacterium brasiliense TaxID=180957 RepID=UPI0015DDF66D|nr:hypothetical protein [Pectobacterium brasiliense]MBA0218811.1 hypothetical protein [Pectobacterium brasiliense]MBN3073179.1 hypothetical protein [Pectobacterium brasiliense]MBN3170600.1 hypothetical protein [Pectobacterium brasiliense]